MAQESVATRICCCISAEVLGGLCVRQPILRCSTWHDMNSKFANALPLEWNGKPWCADSPECSASAVPSANKPWVSTCFRAELEALEAAMLPDQRKFRFTAWIVTFALYNAASYTHSKVPCLRRTWPLLSHFLHVCEVGSRAFRYTHRSRRRRKLHSWSAAQSWDGFTRERKCWMAGPWFSNAGSRMGSRR